MGTEPLGAASFQEHCNHPSLGRPAQSAEAAPPPRGSRGAHRVLTLVSWWVVLPRFSTNLRLSWCVAVRMICWGSFVTTTKHAIKRRLNHYGVEGGDIGFPQILPMERLSSWAYIRDAACCGLALGTIGLFSASLKKRWPVQKCQIGSAAWHRAGKLHKAKTRQSTLAGLAKDSPSLPGSSNRGHRTTRQRGSMDWKSKCGLWDALNSSSITGPDTN